MPSFDIESKVDTHELTNAVDQANRELQNRFDFKGIEAKFEFSDGKITLSAPEEFQTFAARHGELKAKARSPR